MITMIRRRGNDNRMILCKKAANILLASFSCASIIIACSNNNLASAWLHITPSTSHHTQHHQRHADISSFTCLKSSSTTSSSSSSYETWGDGNLISETFTELYSASSSHIQHDDDDNDNEPSQKKKKKKRRHLPDWLLTRAAQLGYHHPTLLQQRALDTLLLTSSNQDDDDNNEDDNDVILHAQTGSGKTLAYLLPLLSRIDVSRAAVQGIIVVPTRELGLQVVRVARRLCAGSVVVTSHSTDDENDDDDDDSLLDDYNDDDTTDTTTSSSIYKRKIMIMPLLQGSSNTRQRAWAWAEPPHIIIGTPDEVTSMVTRGGVRVNSVKMVVVDEVDACLGNNNKGYNDATTTLHELLSRHLSPTYQEVERVATNMELSDGRTVRVSTMDETGSAASLSNNNNNNNASGMNYADKHRQTIFASATIPQHNHFMKQCVQNGWTLREPIRINVSPGELVPPTLKHVYVVCRDKSTKVGGLRRWMKKELKQNASGGDDDGESESGPTKILIFCDPRRPLDMLGDILAKDFNGIVWKEGYTQKQEEGYDSVISVLRMEDSLGTRAAAMEGFRGPDDRTGVARTYDDGRGANGSGGGEKVGDDKLRILLSTDLTARGIDIPNISVVINYDLPNDNEGDTYVHRGGRAGRLGSKGKVMSLITADQEFVLERLANKLSLDIRCVARQDKKKEK